MDRGSTVSEERTYKIDLDWTDWSMRNEQLPYRDQVGVNPGYALRKIQAAFEEVDAEVAALGDKPPDGYVPDALLNIDPRYLVGFVWIAERREKPDLSFRDLLDEVDYHGLVNAVLELIVASVKPEEADPSPLATTTSESSPNPTTPSPSAPPSDGQSSTPKPSRPRASTKP